MTKFISSLCLALVLTGHSALASVAKDHATKEEVTCGLVVDVNKREQMVQMKPVSSSGYVEDIVISRRVLPESVSMAKLVKNHPRIKFCIQLPIAQGGKYKTWATAHKSSPIRIGTM